MLVSAGVGLNEVCCCAGAFTRGGLPRGRPRGLERVTRVGGAACIELSGGRVLGRPRGLPLDLVARVGR